MKCSDVGEFEHIYGQILTTPSCVYGRLFKCTRMVDFNALIVWKTFIDICFSIKSSLWALTAAYTKFRENDLVDDMKLWPSVTSPDVYCYLIETPGDFTWKKKAESIQLCDFRVGQATTGGEAQFWLRQPWRNLPSSLNISLILPPTSAPPLINEGMGLSWWEYCGTEDVCRKTEKIVELKMFVGTF